MNAAELKARLRQALEALGSDDFSDSSASIVKDLESAKPDLLFVKTILRFMEEHPDIYFGTPGDFVHYVERYSRADLETEVLASLVRRPTAHIAWMLNRIINVTKDPEHSKKLINALETARDHPLADDDAKESIADFLKYQSRKLDK